MISPRRASKLTSFTATKSPKRLVSRSATILISPFASVIRASSVRSETNRSSIEGAMRSISSTATFAALSAASSSLARRAASSTTTCTLSPIRIAPFTPSRSATTSRARRASREAMARISPGHQRLQTRRRVAIEHSAVAQEAEPGAALGLVEIGGGDDDGDPLAAQAVENAPEVAPRHRIDAGGRLVEQQHLRRVDERAGEPELLFHAARQLARAPLAERRHAGGREQARRALLPVATADAEEFGEELDVLVDGQVFVEPEPLRHVADVRADAFGIGDRVQALDGDRSFVGLHHRGEQAHDRRLARAVRADEAEHFAGSAVDAEVLDRGDAAEPFGEIARFDCGLWRVVHDWPGARTAIFASAGRPGTSSCEGLSMSMRMR